MRMDMDKVLKIAVTGKRYLANSLRRWPVPVCCAAACCMVAFGGLMVAGISDIRSRLHSTYQERDYWKAAAEQLDRQWSVPADQRFQGNFDQRVQAWLLAMKIYHPVQVSQISDKGSEQVQIAIATIPFDVWVALLDDLQAAQLRVCDWHIKRLETPGWVAIEWVLAEGSV